MGTAKRTGPRALSRLPQISQNRFDTLASVSEKGESLDLWLITFSKHVDWFSLETPACTLMSELWKEGGLKVSFFYLPFFRVSRLTWDLLRVLQFYYHEHRRKQNAKPKRVCRLHLPKVRVQWQMKVRVWYDIHSGDCSCQQINYPIFADYFASTKDSAWLG